MVTLDTITVEVFSCCWKLIVNAQYVSNADIDAVVGSRKV